MNIAEEMRRLDELAKADPIGAAREAREIADKFYAKAARIAESPGYKTEMAAWMASR